MPFQPTTDGALAILHWSFGNVLFTNHLWFSQSDFDASDLTALATALYVAPSGGLSSTWSLLLTLENVEAIDMRSEGAESRQIGDGSVAGVNDNNPLPLSMALVVTLRTLRRGRAYRGRLYMAGYTEASMDTGVWIQDTITKTLSYIEQLEIAAEALGWTFGVRSGQLDGVPRAAGIITPIVAREVRSPQVGHQRSRVKRG